MAMSESRQVREARAEAERSKARLMGTVRDLQYRTNPRTIARGTWQGAKDKSAELADGVVEVVAERPVMVGAIASAVAVFLARQPLMDLAGRVFHWNHDGGSIEE